MGRPRAREFGLKLGTMDPGPLNAITDVEGVGVGHSTVIKGDDVRTGVTAVTPHAGNIIEDNVAAAVDIFNGYGKTVGLPQIVNEGILETPILLTETLNTWRVADYALDYHVERLGIRPASLNVVVGETNGSYLTANLGRQVTRDHVYSALDAARSPAGCGAVPEGNVGGGTPMTGYGFKGGIGTSSRRGNGFTVGVLVQLNCGTKNDLIVAGAPIGRLVKLPEKPAPSPGNSIMMIVATDLSLDSRQLGKVAKRATLGLARTGTIGRNGSGDFTIAFSTGKKAPESKRQGDGFLDSAYRATVESTEEAILNALFKAETMTGVNGHTRYALPLDQVKQILEKRLSEDT